MTKVILTGFLLAYRKAMPKIVSRLIRESFIDGLKVWSPSEPPLARPNLLPPPWIEAIELRFYQGQTDNMIVMAISDDFGVGNVHVILRDEAGKQIESGNAVPDPEYSGCWTYLTTTCVPSGTAVTVQAAATDRLGGVGVGRATRTIP